MCIIITTLCRRYSPPLDVSAWLLEETTIFQVFFDDDVGYGVKHKLDVLCVCGTGHVRVDFFDVSAHVQVQELHFDVVTGILVSVGALTKRYQDKGACLISWPLTNVLKCAAGCVLGVTSPSYSGKHMLR